MSEDEEQIPANASDIHLEDKEEDDEENEEEVQESNKEFDDILSTINKQIKDNKLIPEDRVKLIGKIHNIFSLLSAKTQKLFERKLHRIMEQSVNRPDDIEELKM